MSIQQRKMWYQMRARIRRALSGPHLLAFIPAVSLGAFWLGGEGSLTVVALLLPALFALVGGIDPTLAPGVPLADNSIVTPPDKVEEALETVLQRAAERRRRTVCFLVEIDDFHPLSTRHGNAAAEHLAQRCGDRLQSRLRDIDLVCRSGENRFVAVLEPVRHLDLDTAFALAGRIQTAMEEPVSIDATSIYVSCSVGFCLSSRSPDETAGSLLQAASTALAEAKRQGAGSIRAYSAEMKQEFEVRHVLADEIRTALEDGQFEPFFQPQISTDTGKITGFEALARWIHPQKGMIPPIEFLPTVEQMGQMERLGEIMLNKALAALRAWDQAGFNVPHVGVNFSDAELRNPKLLDKIKWELDRHDLSPDRLTIEVLETVVATSPDDTTARNINALAKFGCMIDLDDFGTGHASISSVRRFAVSRLKIDRSFVMKADRDPDQQRIVNAILTMAERLGLDTLAEGVETVGEHAILAQLGCGHVQGFGIARPMPMDQTLEWIAAHQAKLSETPKIGKKAV